MPAIHTVKLELLRTGPAHNQLLSPLTPYIALCGDSAPTTLHVEHEHHQLLSKLERLRYAVGQGSDVVAVPDRIRESSVAEVGTDVSAILAAVPSLLGEVSRAGAVQVAPPDGPREHPFVHLSIVLGGSELALIPFEFAIAPQAYPGEGLELCLQLAAAVVPTRETRRRLPDQLPWDGVKKPRLLLVAAAPAGLDVPLAGHVQAVREAFEPWIEWPKREAGKDRDRLDAVKAHIRVLPQASVEAIYKACSEETFTHVHILAHGGAYEQAGERRFGLVLCADDDPGRPEIVNGQRLAKALQARSADGARRSAPVVVTLATCDSGNAGSVLVPGGSLAHELHAEGIPWVFASQLPMTKIGSVQLALALYPGLLRGDDPRLVLFEARRRLYMQSRGSHDWASLVVYATIPADFEHSVSEFFEQQSKSAIDVSLARADDLSDARERQEALGRTTQVLARWMGRLPAGDGTAARARRAECFGIHGSTYKRMALIEYKRDPASGDRLLREALSYYRRAMAEGVMSQKFHWVATQALSLAAALADEADAETFDLAWHIALQDLRNPDPGAQAWAHGTLAELEMIRLHHKRLSGAAARGVQSRVVRQCKRVLELMGPASFHVESTRRQFQRYIDYWDKNNGFRPIATAAVKALTSHAAPR